MGKTMEQYLEDAYRDMNAYIKENIEQYKQNLELIQENVELKGELAIADQMIAELQQAKFDSMPIVSRDIYEEKYGLIRTPRIGSDVTRNNGKLAHEGWCNHHTGMIEKAYYYHVKPLKNGTFTLYQGSYSHRASCTVGNLERIGNYPTIEAIDERIGDV